MTEWMTLVGVFIAAGATVAVQLLINRGEPSAIKRIKLLNEAIEGIQGDDEAGQALVGARSKLVAKLAKSLIGLEGFARWLRVGAWTALGVGSVVLVLSILVSGFAGTDSASWTLGVQGLQIAFWLILLAPLMMLYSAIWPGFAADMGDFHRWAVDKRITRGYRRIREAIEADENEDLPGSSGVPAAMTS